MAHAYKDLISGAELGVNHCVPMPMPMLAAGALPRAFPTVSLGEVFLNPTSMVYRNLMSMDTEEMIGGLPMDAVVLIGGCDKTVPAQLMGAASANIPAIQLVTGPMMTGRHKGQRLWGPAPTVEASGRSSVRGRSTVPRFNRSKGASPSPRAPAP
jgi:dihydroxyacid dehydratase/phosphogluconate dehydratase